MKIMWLISELILRVGSDIAPMNVGTVENVGTVMTAASKNLFTLYSISCS